MNYFGAAAGSTARRPVIADFDNPSPYPTLIPPLRSPVAAPAADKPSIIGVIGAQRPRVTIDGDTTHGVGDTGSGRRGVERRHEDWLWTAFDSRPARR